MSRSRSGHIDWAMCPASRAALAVIRGRDDCAFPGECHFWDWRQMRCGLRFQHEWAAATLALRELAGLGHGDLEVGLRLGVARSTVAKWRTGAERAPERRAAQIEALLAEARLLAGSLAGPRADLPAGVFRREASEEVRRMLAFLRAHGWHGAKVAGFCGVSRASVSKWWRGLSLPTARNLGALTEKYEEVGAGVISRIQKGNYGQPAE